VKRPGQTLGLYIREGNGLDRSDGVFISRIALESAVYNSGCLKVGDEILAVNMVDVTRMSLDDVVIIMSIPRRLVLVTRQRKAGRVPIKCLSYEEICCLCCASLFSVLDCGIFVCSLACFINGGRMFLRLRFTCVYIQNEFFFVFGLNTTC
jgi:hypothetical protein